MDSDGMFTYDKEFHEIINNKDTLKKVTEKFLNNMIDEFALGIILEMHRKYKTRSFDFDEGNSAPADEEMLPNVDIFGQNNLKKIQECECPYCDRTVAATRFAPHLEQCMGKGRIRSRNSSRRIANNNSNTNNKERENAAYITLPSDDEADADWNSGDKRRKKKYRNGSKKGTPKKATSETTGPAESVNVDIEGDEDGDISLKDILQDNSNHSSPTESVASSSARKRDKAKSKKNSKRDRASPCASILN